MSVDWEKIICAGIETLDLNDCSQAEKELNESAKDYCKQGNAYNKSGNLDSVIACFTRTIELNSNDINAYFGRGASYSYLGQYQ